MPDIAIVEAQSPVSGLVEGGGEIFRPENQVGELMIRSATGPASRPSHSYSRLTPIAVVIFIKSSA